MRKRSLSALVMLALAVPHVGAQAQLAPPVDMAPGPAGPSSPSGLPAQYDRPSAPAAPESAPESFNAPDPAGGPLPQTWQRMEYLLWWIRDTRLPPLVTAGHGNSVPVLGNPGTTVLVGNSPLDNQDRSGGRFTIGWALDSAQTVGVEASYFFLGTRTTTVGASSSGATGSPSLAVPYFDVTTGKQQAQTIAFPGFASGTVSVSSSARMQGAELNGVANLWNEDWLQFDGLFGFRYLELDEGLQLAYSSERLTPSTSGAGLALGAADQFDGHNRFYGGQAGLRLELRTGLVFLNLAGKVALGDMNEVVRINGVSSSTAPGQAPVLRSGGTLALPTNSGRFAREGFAFVPEATVQVGVFLSRGTKLFVGYNVLYLSQVARPGDQIDTSVNPRQMPLSTRSGPFVGPASPAFTAHTTDFLAQGLLIGLEYRY